MLGVNCLAQGQNGRFVHLASDLSVTGPKLTTRLGVHFLLRPCSNIGEHPAPPLFLWVQALFMTQTVHTPLVSEDNIFVGLKLISYNSTQLGMGTKMLLQF